MIGLFLQNAADLGQVVYQYKDDSKRLADQISDMRKIDKDLDAFKQDKSDMKDLMSKYLDLFDKDKVPSLAIDHKQALLKKIADLKTEAFDLKLPEALKKIDLKGEVFSLKSVDLSPLIERSQIFKPKTPDLSMYTPLEWWAPAMVPCWFSYAPIRTPFCPAFYSPCCWWMPV